jgi:phage N-6-adenine-methyltransferase
MANDLWRTPPEVFHNLNTEFNFIADMAASHENALHNQYFTENDDSLSFNWADKLQNLIAPNGVTYAWCNPPYSNPKPWIVAAAQAQDSGLGVVMLLNADTSTEWFLNALPWVSEVRNITGYRLDGKWKTGRLAFLDETGKPVSGNNKAQFVLIFNPFKKGLAINTYVTKLEIMKPVELPKVA